MNKLICAAVLLIFTIFTNYCFAQEKKVISFYTWKDYTEKSILEDFEKHYGIKVILKEYDNRDQMFSEIQSAPQEFDVILATDVTLPMLSQSKLLEPLDLSRIPNRKFIKNEFKNLPYDPENKNSVVAGLWGAAGLVINTDFVPADTDSWSVLWDEKYKGKIALLDDCRDAMSVLFKHSSFSINTTDPDELKVALSNGQLLVANGVQFGDALGNVEKVLSGELWIAQAYNGDVVSLAKGRQDIKFIFPKEGYGFSVDNLVMSVDSKHKDEALQFIDFYLDPKNVARTANAMAYPITIEAESYLRKEILNDPVIFPPPEVIQKGEYILDIGETEGEYLRIFHALKQQEE